MMPDFKRGCEVCRVKIIHISHIFFYLRTNNEKIISSVVLLTVLAGAVTMIVGCGEKPAKESVWRNPNYDKSQLGIKLLAFHSDGNLYAFRAIQTTIGHSSVIEEKVKVIAHLSKINSQSELLLQRVNRR